MQDFDIIYDCIMNTGSSKIRILLITSLVCRKLLRDYEDDKRSRRSEATRPVTAMGLLRDLKACLGQLADLKSWAGAAFGPAEVSPDRIQLSASSSFTAEYARQQRSFRHYKRPLHVLSPSNS